MSPRARTTAPASSVEISIDGCPVAIAVRRSDRARRYTLKLVSATGEPLLVIPAHGNLERARAFAQSQAGWLRERLRRSPGQVPFEDGVEVPLRGEAHRLNHAGTRRGTVRLAPPGADGDLPRILVAGAREHLARRLVDWLKAEARADLEPAVLAYAAKLGVSPKRISVRDQTSRWGSCSATGTLSFSWRLILAPPQVLDYLAAHEVTHLFEMNHSARFWRTLRAVAPHTDQSETWLKRHGTSLFRYGPR